MSYRVGNVDALQRLAVVKRRITNLRYGIGNVDVLQRLAVAKRRITNMIYRVWYIDMCIFRKTRYKSTVR